MGTSADLAVRCGGRTGYAALTQRLSEDPFKLSDEEHWNSRDVEVFQDPDRFLLPVLVKGGFRQENPYPATVL